MPRPTKTELLERLATALDQIPDPLPPALVSDVLRVVLIAEAVADLTDRPGTMIVHMTPREEGES
jgi:hypothetical protein